MIGKNFVALHTLLTDNQDSTVADILEACVELMQSELTDKVTRMNENGDLEVYCWYHKVWENTEEIDYGSKKSNKSTGLNTFCKVGVNCWTKQQRDFKTNSANILLDVAEGKLKADEITAKLLELGKIRDAVEPRDVYLLRKETEKAEKLAAS